MCFIFWGRIIWLDSSSPYLGAVVKPSRLVGRPRASLFVTGAGAGWGALCLLDQKFGACGESGEWMWGPGQFPNALKQTSYQNLSQDLHGWMPRPPTTRRVFLAKRTMPSSTLLALLWLSIICIATWSMFCWRCPEAWRKKVHAFIQKKLTLFGGWNPLNLG